MERMNQNEDADVIGEKHNFCSDFSLSNNLNYRDSDSIVNNTYSENKEISSVNMDLLWRETTLKNAEDGSGQAFKYTAALYSALTGKNVSLVANLSGEMLKPNSDPYGFGFDLTIGTVADYAISYSARQAAITCGINVAVLTAPVPFSNVPLSLTAATVCGAAVIAPSYILLEVAKPGIKKAILDFEQGLERDLLNIKSEICNAISSASSNAFTGDQLLSQSIYNSCMQ